MFSVNYFCRFRQLFLPVHPLFLTALLGHSGAVAGDVEFQDDRVVDHPVDGCGCGHWVGEDVLPLGEDQVGRDAQGPAFVAFGDEREEHLGLLGPLGQVPQVVQQQEVVVVAVAPGRAWPPAGPAPAGRLGRRGPSVRLPPAVAQGAQCMGLAGAGQSEGQHVDASVDEAAVRQLAQLLPQSLLELINRLATMGVELKVLDMSVDQTRQRAPSSWTGRPRRRALCGEGFGLGSLVHRIGLDLRDSLPAGLLVPRRLGVRAPDGPAGGVQWPGPLPAPGQQAGHVGAGCCSSAPWTSPWPRPASPSGPGSTATSSWPTIRRIALFAVVFTSLWLSLAWTTLTAVAYTLVSLTVGVGIDVDAGDEKVLLGRLAAMYALVLCVSLITRFERIRRQTAVDRERRVQQERIEFSQAVHDTTAQTAYLISLGIQRARELVGKSDEELVAALDATGALSRSAMWELRRPIDAGRIFEGRELGRVLGSHCATFERITGVPARMSQSGTEPPLAVEVRSRLFSIAHNALTNAFLHARTGWVEVSLSFEGGQIRLSVSDDGVGLPDDYAERGHGFGGMRADAERMGGALIVESGEAGGGTTIACVVPY